MYVCVCMCMLLLPSPPLSCSDKVGEERLEQELGELEAGLEAAKEELSVATTSLRAMIRAFKESRLLPQPGQFSSECYIFPHGLM